MAVRRITLDKYLIEARRISAHRTKQAEKGIRRTYKKVLKEMNHFLADTYVKHAKNDTLTYTMLQQQNEYANFMETIQKKVDGILPEVQKQIQTAVKETYKNAYNGMIKAVNTANTTNELHANLTGIEACRPETIKRAVENPVSGLTLKDRLEKNRKNVVYDIKQQIGVGLANGDRYTTMAERVSECLDGDYQKAVRVVRTETHRVEEAGNLDASLSMEEELNNVGMATTKTWVTMDDIRVRHGKKANHVKMEGKTVPIDEMFDLGKGIKAMSPGNSGDAANDIHCRCYLSYDLEELEESNIIKPNSESLGFDEYEEQEIIEMSKEADKIVNQYVENPSKWSGNTIVNSNQDISAGKEWNCNISTRKETAMHILIHEHIHAHSVSYFTPNKYVQFQTIEEGSVELLAKEITKKHGFEVLESGYDDTVNVLKEINKNIKLYETDLEFAQKLIQIPMNERLPWLEKEAEKVMGERTIEECMRLSELIEQLY